MLQALCLLASREASTSKVHIELVDWNQDTSILITSSIGTLQAQQHTAQRQRQAEMNLNGQDWDQVVLRKNKPKPGTAPKKEAAVNEALRTGGQVEAIKKFGAGANKITGAGKDAAKLDRETEELHHDRYVAVSQTVLRALLFRSCAHQGLCLLVSSIPHWYTALHTR